MSRFETGGWPINAVVRVLFCLRLALLAGCASTAELGEVDRWAIQLQGIERPGAIRALVESDYDLVVLDVVDSVRGMEQFDTRGVVAKVKKRGRICLAYLNVGQAEDYRTDFDKGLALSPDPEGWRGDYVAAGGMVAAAVFTKVDSSITVTHEAADGEIVSDGDILLRVAGPAAAILTAERTALNFLQRMTGIATLTNLFVEKAKAYGVAILDTRKTTPGQRVLEKYAVLCGGGENHRMGLYDRVLIKENHLSMREDDAQRDAGAAVIAARARYPGLVIEVEVENEIELAAALGASPDWILLDNMLPSELQKCVEVCAGRCKLEASGGITIENIGEIVVTGVDAISLGCLTHSAPAADLSLGLKRN